MLFAGSPTRTRCVPINQGSFDTASGPASEQPLGGPVLSPVDVPTQIGTDLQHEQGKSLFVTT